MCCKTIVKKLGNPIFVSDGITRPDKAMALKAVLESIIPEPDRNRLRVVVVDISKHSQIYNPES
jgi:hypothetical protein